MLPNKKLLSTILSLILAQAGFWAFLYAQTDEGFIQYRQRLMTSNAASMGAMGDILKHRLPFSPEHIASHARVLHETSKLLVRAFEQEVTAGETDAKPEIWSDWEGFTTAARQLEEESEKLYKMAESGETTSSLISQVQSVGKTCGGCHDQYRKPESESYKR